MGVAAGAGAGVAAGEGEGAAVGESVAAESVVAAAASAVVGVAAGAADGVAPGVDVDCAVGESISPAATLRAPADTGSGSPGVRSMALPHPLMSSMLAAPASTAAQKRRGAVPIHLTVRTAV
jgi:hypothetical protein